VGYRGWRLWDALSGGSRRRRRTLDRQLNQLDRLEEIEEIEFRPSRVPSMPRVRSAGRHKPARAREALIVGVALALTFTAYHYRNLGNPSVSPAMPAQSFWPGAPDDQADHPLGAPLAPPAGSGGYVFVHTRPDGQPVAYDPCRPIHYVVSRIGASAENLAILSAAIKEVSTATGLRFENDGFTDERWSRSRPIVVSDYGNRFAPVLIVWARPDEVPDLDGSIAGLGGSRPGLAPGASPDDLHYVTGSVALDVDDFADMLAHPEGVTEATDVTLHELGHLVGLDHVADSSQLMAPELAQRLDGYQAGDLRGLSRLGVGPCYPDG
jgi:hypothetical protein